MGNINEFLNVTFMDALCYNIDRHTFNFGILRKLEDVYKSYEMK
jgi:hypothetical protein